MKRLVLFDIDGTLIRGGKLWEESYVAAVRALFPGTELPKIAFGGKTDHQIYREILTAARIEACDFERCMHEVMEGYLARARAGLATRQHELRVLPGVREMVGELSRMPEICLGLLTGNIRAGAALKLEAAGLDGFFRLGVYGDDHWDRYELPRIAVARARDQVGVEFSGKQIVIIGDTTHDVRCGRSIGVRAIAVGTGHGIPMEELLAENPDYYFKDLADYRQAIAAILED